MDTLHRHTFAQSHRRMIATSHLAPRQSFVIERASIQSAASPNNGLAKGASADRCQQAPKVSS
jgi:hypothetical protein